MDKTKAESQNLKDELKREKIVVDEYFSDKVSLNEQLAKTKESYETRISDMSNTITNLTKELDGNRTMNQAIDQLTQLITVCSNQSIARDTVTTNSIDQLRAALTNMDANSMNRDGDLYNRVTVIIQGLTLVQNAVICYLKLKFLKTNKKFSLKLSIIIIIFPTYRLAPCYEVFYQRI